MNLALGVDFPLLPGEELCGTAGTVTVGAVVWDRGNCGGCNVSAVDVVVSPGLRSELERLSLEGRWG